jgi:hypothetical protein
MVAAGINGCRATLLLYLCDTEQWLASVQFSYVLHPFAARYSHWDVAFGLIYLCEPLMTECTGASQILANCVWRQEKATWFC